MSLVAGYDSDSDADEGGREPLVARAEDAALSRGTLSASLPPPTNPQQQSVKQGQKRKQPQERRVIHVESIKHHKGDGQDEQSKKPKRPVGVGGSGSSGLFAMLPAPVNKTHPKSTERRDESVLNTLGVAGDSAAGAMVLQEPIVQDESDSTTSKKSKGNADFRAMLGLKPSKVASKEEATTARTEPVVPLPQSKTSSKGSKPDAADTPALDFFSLQGDEDVARNDSAAGPSTLPVTISVALAPMVEEEDFAQKQKEEQGWQESEDPYQGWQQGSDGAWFPVTPEAHAKYSAYLAEQASGASERGLHAAESEAMGARIDPSRIHDVDANANMDEWHARPPQTSTADAGAGGRSDLDQRYALAAASVANPNRRDDDDEDDEHGKRPDKAANSRARRKGQLSSLITQAQENREKLEERWSRGRAARNEAQKRYGF